MKDFFSEKIKKKNKQSWIKEKKFYSIPSKRSIGVKLKFSLTRFNTQEKKRRGEREVKLTLLQKGF